MQKKPCKIYSNPKNKNREKFTMNLMLMNKFSEAQAKKTLQNLQWTLSIKQGKIYSEPQARKIYSEP